MDFQLIHVYLKIERLDPQRLEMEISKIEFY